jgi:hypothetical protein
MKQWWLSVAVLGLLTSMGSGDVVTLKNGTKIEGIVFKFDTEYRIKQADGVMKTVKVKDVASLTKGDAAPGAAASSTDDPRPANVSPAMLAALTAAKEAQTADEGVSIWQKFIAAKPAASELKLAQDELNRWQKRVDDKLVMYDGQWMTAAERDQFTDALILASWRRVSSWSYKRIDNAIQLLNRYPRSFQASFSVGFLYLTKVDQHVAPPPGDPYIEGYSDRVYEEWINAAIVALNRATSLNPDSYEAWSELSMAYRHKWKIAEAIDAAIKGYKLHPADDTRLAIQGAIMDGNKLIGMKKNSTGFKKQLDAATAEYGPGKEAFFDTRFALGVVRQMIPSPPQRAEGQINLGVGFLLTEKGHLLIPKSLLKEDCDVWVYMRDWWLKPATILATDPAHDLALLKVEHPVPLPCLRPSDQSSDEQKHSGTFLTYRHESNNRWLPAGLEIAEGSIKTETEAVRYGAFLVTPRKGVTQMVTGSAGLLTFIDGAAMRSFVDANRAQLKGVTEGPSPQNDPQGGISGADATVLVFVTQKGSPPPGANPAAPATAPISSTD